MTGLNRRVLILAFYLPQFHPIPENDAWWGVGFTEWRNVATAARLYRGHYQPRIPADLGFYDLRLPTVRRQQAELATEAGIDGFIYWHYWFHGKELMAGPLRDNVESQEPRFPFCIAWANQDWTRRWAGHDSDILIRQTYSEADDIAHIQSLKHVLTDRRYINIEGKPLLFVYRAASLPDPRSTAQLWRSEARSWGLEGIHLVSVESSPSEEVDPRAWDFDASVQFEPAFWRLRRPSMSNRTKHLLARLRGHEFPRVIDYTQAVDAGLRRMTTPTPYTRWPGVAVGFDNTPRYGSDRRALILRHSSPHEYERWLAHALNAAARTASADGGHPGQPLVVINAWNEWAEGNYLEPDLVFGRTYLEATRRAIDRAAQRSHDTWQGAMEPRQ